MRERCSANIIERISMQAPHNMQLDCQTVREGALGSFCPVRSGELDQVMNKSSGVFR